MIRFYTPAATAAALFLGGWSTTTTSAVASAQPALTPERFGLTFGVTERHESSPIPNSVRATTTVTPVVLATEFPSECSLFDDRQERGVGYLHIPTTRPAVQPSSTAKYTSHPDGSSNIINSPSKATAGATACEDIRKGFGDAPIGDRPVLLHWWGTPAERGLMPGRTGAVSRLESLMTPPMPLQTASTPSAHQPWFGDEDHDSNGPNWRRFREELPMLPDEFMERVINSLMYLAEVVDADVVGAFLFERYPPRYYQTNRSNRNKRRRRRRFLRFARMGTHIVVMCLEACHLIVESSPLVEERDPRERGLLPAAVEVGVTPPAHGPYNPALEIDTGRTQTMNNETHQLFGPRVNLLPPAIPTAPYPQTPSRPPSTRALLLSTPPPPDALPTIPEYAEDLPTLGTPDTANPMVMTIAETDPHADTTAETPPAPFFVSELGSFISDSYVDALGVSYTELCMTYSYTFTHKSRNRRHGTPRVRRTGGIKDILWPAANSRMRCEWSRSYTTISELDDFYYSSARAIFKSDGIPDLHDFELLRDVIVQQCL